MSAAVGWKVAFMNVIIVGAGEVGYQLARRLCAENKNVIVIDKKALLEAFDGDQAFLKEIIDMFMADTPKMLQDIKAAIDAKNADTLQRTAHAFKGMLGNFQVETAVAKAYALEEMGRNASFEMAEPVFAELSNLVAELERSLVEVAGDP